MVGAPSVPRGFVIISDQPNALVWAFSELLVEPMKGEGAKRPKRLSSAAATQTVWQPG